MTSIALLTICLIERDAVSHDVAGMFRALTLQGHAVHIFADIWDVTEPRVRHVKEIENVLHDDSAILIYHHAAGWDVGLSILDRAKCKKVIKYHNVTPPEFFDDINSDYAIVCRAGRIQLEALAQIPEALYLSDSEYNMQELLSQGAPEKRNFVVP